MDHRGDGVSPVAIVGGSGFIGRSLSARLTASGDRVRIVGVTPSATGPNVEWVEADVRDREAVRRALHGARAIYHLAAVRWADSGGASACYETNVRGTRNVCEAASASGISRIVFTSSASVYGVSDGADETRACRPRGHYGRSKLEAEQVLREWAAAGPGRRAAIVRPSVVFGPRADGVGNFLIRSALFPGFALAGSGSQRKSLAYVENLVAFLEFVAGRPEPMQLFNYGDEPDLTVREIVSTVRQAAGLPPAPSRSTVRLYAAALRNSVARRLGRESGLGAGGLRNALRERTFDSRRAHSTGFIQPIDVREGLTETVGAYAGWVSIMRRAARA